MDFELTETGLSTPRFPQARALTVERWSRFGDNEQTASDSPDGLIIDTIATLVTLMWEGVAAVYRDSFFRSSSTIALDRLLDLFGRRRIQPSRSTADAFFFGGPGLTITSGTSVAVEGTETRFTVDTNVVTTANDPIVVVISNAVGGNTYGVTVSTTTESTVVAPATGATTESIAALLVTQLQTDNPGMIVQAAGAQPNGDAVIVLNTLGGATITVGPSTTVAGDMAIHNATRANLTATATGPLTAVVGTLNTIESSVPAGIVGVANVTDADVGRNLETNAEYRRRHIDTINQNGGSSLQAIRARLLALRDANGDQLLDGVAVFHNVGQTVDADGRDPGEIEVVWIGPAGTDTEQTVAEAIFAAVPAGNGTHGDITTNVTDATSQIHAINHSRGDERYLHINIVITPGEGYPTTGDPLTAIRDAVVTYLSEGGGGALGLGSDFLHFSLGNPINDTVTGVAAAAITSDATTNPTDTPTLTAADIIVDANGILRVDTSRVTVTQAP